jgi:hypothetical protein
MAARARRAARSAEVTAGATTLPQEGISAQHQPAKASAPVDYDETEKGGMMKWSQWLEEWGMTGLKINLKFLEMEFKPQAEDQDAAWEMYIELLTRVTTQALAAEHGDEKTALSSVHALFPLTREIIKQHGRHCIEFTKIAVVVLNQVIRPFTAKWHGRSLDGAFDDLEQCVEFRSDLRALQAELGRYSRMLSDMAGVEDLTGLEDG